MHRPVKASGRAAALVDGSRVSQSARISEGTGSKIVAPLRSSVSISRSGSRTVWSDMIWVHAPISGPVSVCHTEMSKQDGAVCAMTSSGPRPSGSTFASMLFSIPSRVIIAPFGSPVEPEVKRM